VKSDQATVTGVSLNPLSANDVEQIRAWPKYSGAFAPLDYALRSGGWLDMFPESSRTRRLGAWVNAEFVGFSLLVDITQEAAEFYIAVHPALTGKKLGEQITTATLLFAFRELQLKRVYLKVRIWHTGAKRLYEKCGFVVTGSIREEIQGEMVDFCLMEARNPVMRSG
jgi:RimJ/RimL family protein N-acetyltransferase